jgi:hypothetical protein
LTRWVVFLLLATTPAAAQRGQMNVSGIVSDATTGRPLGGVLVALTGGTRATRTDDAGQYVILVPRTGEVILEVRRIGYEPRRISIQVNEGVEKMERNVALQRVATLDTVRVRAADRAVYGIVAAASDLRPLPGAHVQLLSAGLEATTDSTGHFFIPFRSGQTFVVRARAPSHSPQTMSLSVPPTGGLEVVLLLDSGSSPKRLDFAWGEFDQRSKWRNITNSAVVPRMELIKNYESELLHSLRSAPSFVSRSLRFLDTVCLFVDGVAQPFRSMSSFAMADIELVETYTANSDAGRELQRKWPPRVGCESPTGAPRAPGGVGPTSDVVRYIVIWLKR